MNQVPTVGVYEKFPVMQRKPCWLDTVDLEMLGQVNAKLHKKAAIALTKWAVWCPRQLGWYGKPFVQLTMFEADRLGGYRDTRVWHGGKLIDMCSYMRCHG